MVLRALARGALFLQATVRNHDVNRHAEEFSRNRYASLPAGPSTHNHQISTQGFGPADVVQVNYRQFSEASASNPDNELVSSNTNIYDFRKNSGGV
jgi:hypothetical protein